MDKRILNLDFIPHSRFHHTSWYREIGGARWYWYGIPRVYNRLPSSLDFYETLDTELLGIVKKLHQYGIPTTPSCAGHISSSDFHQKIWDELKEQESRIRKNGIILEDPETNQKVEYKHKNFNLPWSKDEFVKIGRTHQKKGCLGVCPPQRYINEFNIKIPGFLTKKDNTTIIYLSESETKSEIEKKWSTLENYLERICKFILV